MKRKWSIIILCLFLFLKGTQTQLVAGTYARGIEQVAETGLIIYSTGALECKAEGQKIDLIDMSHIEESKRPKADQYCSLFRLNSEKIVFLSGESLNIYVFKDKIKDLIYLSTSNLISMGIYQYTLLDDTSFTVIWQSSDSYNARSFLVNPTVITEIVSATLKISCLPSTGCSGITCKFNPIQKKYLCLYGTNSPLLSLAFHIYNSNFQSLGSFTDISKKNISNLELQYIENDLFIACYYLDKSYYCLKIEFNTENTFIIGDPILISNNINSLNTRNSNTILGKYKSLFNVIYDGSKISFRQLTTNLDIIGDILGGTEQDITMISLFNLGKDKVLYVYVSQNYIYTKSFTFPVCDNKQVITQMLSDIPIPITFNFTYAGSPLNPSDGKLFFLQIPQIALLRQKEIDKHHFININTTYSLDGYELTTFYETGITTINFTGLKTPVSSSECKVTIIICYFTCKECKTNQADNPSAIDHQCTSCKTDYYPISGKESQCVNNLTKPIDHYLNSSTGKYEKCHESCGMCETTKENCLICNTEYFKVEGSTKCVKSDTILEGYFINNNMFMKCYGNCKQCSDFGSDKENNCLSCKDGFTQVNIYDKAQCDPICEGKWSYDKVNNKVTCIGTGSCPLDFPYLVASVDSNIINQCVTSCNAYKKNYDCIICQEKELFLYNSMTCVEKCPPPETVPNYQTHECVLPSSIAPDLATLCPNYCDKDSSWCGTKTKCPSYCQEDINKCNLLTGNCPTYCQNEDSWCGIKEKCPDYCQKDPLHCNIEIPSDCEKICQDESTWCGIKPVLCPNHCQVEETWCGIKPKCADHCLADPTWCGIQSKCPQHCKEDPNLCGLVNPPECNEYCKEDPTWCGAKPKCPDYCIKEETWCGAKPKCGEHCITEETWCGIKPKCAENCLADPTWCGIQSKCADHCKADPDLCGIVKPPECNEYCKTEATWCGIKPLCPDHCLNDPDWCGLMPKCDEHCIETCKPSAETCKDFCKPEDICPECPTNPDCEICPTCPGTPDLNKRLKVYKEDKNTDQSKLFSQFTMTNRIENYFKEITYEIDSNKQYIDLIFHFTGTDYSTIYYRLSDADIVNKVYSKNKISGIDFSTVYEKLKDMSMAKARSLTQVNLEDIYVMQFDIYRENEPINQTEYLLFYQDQSMVDVTSLDNDSIIISSPIQENFFTSKYMVESETMFKKDIDIFNKSSLFYNDVCFRYVTDNNRDTVIPDRREVFYPKKELCEKNCEYSSYDPVNKKVNCKCPIKSFLPFTTDIFPNPPAIAFPDKDYQTYNVVKCIMEVFDTSHIVINAAFWVYLSCCVTIIVLAFCFICAGMEYASDYIKEVLKPTIQTNSSSILPCPPKSGGERKSGNIEESFTQIEEEQFVDIKLNNFQKKETQDKLQQNFIRDSKIKSRSAEKDMQDKKLEIQKNLINKLKEGLAGEFDPSANPNMYYFTKNSENESNPNYTRKISTENNNETGRSSTHFNNELIKEMLVYDDDDDMSEKPYLDKNPFEQLGISSIANNSKREDEGQANSPIKKSQLLLLRANVNKMSDIPEAMRNEVSVNVKNSNDEIKDNKLGTEMIEKNREIQNSQLVMNQIKDDDNDINIKTPNSFCRAYYNYTKRREIFFVTFCSNKSYLPFFITFPIFLFCMTIMFTIHALFYTNGYIHDRYVQEGSISFAFWMEKEFFKCLYIALIGNLVKIIIIKILIFLVFRIEKKMLSKKNHPVILQRLRCRSTTIFVILIIVMGVLFYINTCYCGIFENNQDGLFIGYIISVFFSFLFGLLLCLIINIIRAIGISCNCS